MSKYGKSRNHFSWNSNLLANHFFFLPSRYLGLSVYICCAHTWLAVIFCRCNFKNCLDASNQVNFGGRQLSHRDTKVPTPFYVVLFKRRKKSPLISTFARLTIETIRGNFKCFKNKRKEKVFCFFVFLNKH
jgi:hypothetical protein